jgi:transketolase
MIPSFTHVVNGFTSVNDHAASAGREARGPFADPMSLARMCLNVRRDIVEMIHAGGGGHVGGSLSLVEILTVLYFETMNVRPQEPNWPDRDRLVLSKGHASSVLYSILARRGFFPVEDLWTFNSAGTRFQKHIDMHRVPGVDVSSGSLGHGLSIGAGMALADRLDRKDRRVYVVMSDGECQAGQTWEAAMAAAHFHLDHITAFVDCNGLETDGLVKDIMAIEPLEAKWRSFGWHVQRIDGHHLGEIRVAIRKARATDGQPHIILADTIKGKGLSFVENQVAWHSHAISDEDYQKAMAELDMAERQLVGAWS